MSKHTIGDANQDETSRHPSLHIIIYKIVQGSANDDCVQVPIRAKRMQEEVLEVNLGSEEGDVLINGKNRSHIDVSAFHDDIGNRQPKESLQEILGLLRDVHQVTRYEQEARHVEGVHHLFDVGVKLLEPHQVETDDEQYQDALQKVYFLDSWHRGFTFVSSVLRWHFFIKTIFICHKGTKNSS